jgi:hypothetical protein
MRLRTAASTKLQATSATAGELIEKKRFCFQADEHVYRTSLEHRDAVTIGFCLIRQSSASPIVSLRQSNQIAEHTP